MALIIHKQGRNDEFFGGGSAAQQLFWHSADAAACSEGIKKQWKMGF